MDKVSMVTVILTAVLGGLATLITLIIWKNPWIKYDLLTIWKYRVLKTIMKNIKNKITILDTFDQNVKKHPQKTFLIFEDKTYSNEYVSKQMNKISHVGETLGLRRGDVAAILMYNAPDFLWNFYGLVRLGVQVALLNTGLKSTSLLHCIEKSGAKLLIVGGAATLHKNVETILESLKDNGVKVWAWNHGGPNEKHLQCLDELYSGAPETGVKLDKETLNNKQMTDPMCYIFTSGTTGLPKASVITHRRALYICCFANLAGLAQKDVLFVTLPLYHTSACFVGVGGAIMTGSTILLRKKFSASTFWKDCVDNNVTAIMYIGELCRFLCQTQRSKYEGSHKVRTAIGNGLRRDIWPHFRHRFNITNIMEFYGSTEGNVSCFNLFNRMGSAGRLSPFLNKIIGTKSCLVHYNHETEEVWRDKNGRCEEIPPGQAGLLIGEITNKLPFDGYKDDEAENEKKILRNVFVEGDAYYNTGDVLGMDQDNFVYFADRLGDTFRWRGENVSTVEVSNVLSSVGWIEDANVYGVTIPGEEGRAGMATLRVIPDLGLNDVMLEELYMWCQDLMPPFAIPRFLRIQSDIQLTETFKQRKHDLVKEGFNPDTCGTHALYYINHKDKTFSTLNKQAYDNICDGDIKL